MHSPSADCKHAPNEIGLWFRIMHLVWFWLSLVDLGPIPITPLYSVLFSDADSKQSGGRKVPSYFVNWDNVTWNMASAVVEKWEKFRCKGICSWIVVRSFSGKITVYYVNRTLCKQQFVDDSDVTVYWHFLCYEAWVNSVQSSSKSPALPCSSDIGAVLTLLWAGLH